MQPEIQRGIEFLQAQLAKLAHRPRILIVDDEDNDIELLQRLLANFCCEVFTCHTADEAIAKISSKQFDLVFLDIILQPSSGLDVLEKIGNDVTNFIVVSGVLDSPNVVEALKSGAIKAWKKPVTIANLKSILTPNERI